MKSLSLLAIGLLLGTASIAQEVKSQNRSTQKATMTANNNTSKKSAEASGNTQTDIELKQTAEGVHPRNRGAEISELTKSVDGSATGKSVRDVASSLTVQPKAEQADNHGAVVSTTATAELGSDVKGTAVSAVASSVGQVQSAANTAVKNVDVATQTAVKAVPAVKAQVNTNTKVDVKPVNVRTNTKIRTAVNIK